MSDSGRGTVPLRILVRTLAGAVVVSSVAVGLSAGCRKSGRSDAVVPRPQSPQVKAGSLEVNREKVKALWNEGVSKLHGGDADGAIACFEAALHLDPGNAGIREKLQQLRPSTGTKPKGPFPPPRKFDGYFRTGLYVVIGGKGTPFVLFLDPSHSSIPSSPQERSAQELLKVVAANAKDLKGCPEVAVALDQQMGTEVQGKKAEDMVHIAVFPKNGARLKGVVKKELKTL